MKILDQTTWQDWKQIQKTVEELDIKGREIDLILEMIEEAIAYRAGVEFVTLSMFDDREFAEGVKPPGAMF